MFTIAVLFLGLFSSVASAQVVATQNSLATGYRWIMTVEEPTHQVRTLYFSSTGEQIALQLYTGIGCMMFISDGKRYSLSPGATCTNFTITKL